ncbi:MAG TPA: HAMP domain-containing sensor histidine kinase [Thermoanaerobaculia bacterium]
MRSLLESLLRYTGDVRSEDREDFVTALEVASRRIDALGRFVSGFADVVRIPSPHRATMNFTDTLRGLIALITPEAEARRIQLEIDINGNETVNADALQLEQVVLNVLRNAMDAAGEDGTVRIALHDGTLTIADSGPGIADSDRPHLFTPFFTTKREGRGIGLTVVQEVLRNHGFPFALENGAGGGAEFTVRFPTREHDVAATM